jgi:NAD(P)-dependent dehydrogenase (short-subunit alcohol dehydrogenase family)
MQNLEGKTALITGGASGIGFALAQTLLAEGMQVVITDVDGDALASAEMALRGSNTQLLALTLDVTDRAGFAAVAQAVRERFGNLHLLCNNAGVYRGGTLDKVTYEDWDWVMGVNVGGVVNGLQTFVEGMRDHGEGAHIVNTASMAGINASPGLGVYNTSKFAVVGMSETLRHDLAPHDIGVSVLCPGMVQTRILESERTRPSDFDVQDSAALAAAEAQSEAMQVAMGAAISPEEVAQVVVNGIKSNEFYLFPHPEMKSFAAARSEELLGAFGEADPARVAAQHEFMQGLLER